MELRWNTISPLLIRHFSDTLDLSVHTVKMRISYDVCCACYVRLDVCVCMWTGLLLMPLFQSVHLCHSHIMLNSLRSKTWKSSSNYVHTESFSEQRARNRFRPSSDDFYFTRLCCSVRFDSIHFCVLTWISQCLLVKEVHIFFHSLPSHTFQLLSQTDKIHRQKWLHWSNARISRKKNNVLD